MVEPAGAMAMFVLRLAGLLSLENALQDQEANLTDVRYNLTDLSLNESLSLANLSWPRSDRQTTLVTDLGDPSKDSPITDSSSTITSSPPVSPPLRTLPPSTTHKASTSNFTHPISTVTTTTSTTTSTTTTTTPRPVNIPTQPQRHRTLGPKTPVPPINLRNSKGSHSSGRRRSPIPHVRRRKITRGPSSDSTRSSQTTLGQDSISPEVSRLANSTTYQQIPRPADADVPRSEGSHETITTGTGRARSIAAISPSESAHLTDEVGILRKRVFHGMSESTSELYPEDFSPVAHLPVTAKLQHPYDEEMTPPPVAPTLRTEPRLEMLMEEDDQLVGLLDQPKLRSLEAPPEDFVESDFEYYDFGVHLQTETPTLSSLNLVSPIPVAGYPPAPSASESSWSELTEDTRHPAPTKPKKLPPARPIPPAYPRSGLRNNPYPYGPKLLPGPYAPLTPILPSATEDGHIDRHIATEYSYEDDFDYYYDSYEAGEPKIEVQTKEPPVLFVFDKPGYSPEHPTTLLPVTRAPTPSDPWDCAPRCPSYTLLDWNTDYDVRQYPYTSWVSTVIISDNRVLAELEGYMRVQDYFYGLNDQGLVLNLSIPFVTQIKFGKHPGVLHETNDYTVSLYVPPSYTKFAELPTPISNEVLVDELEQKTIFVHGFEANVWDVTERFLEEKVGTLMSQLRHNGEAFLDRYYYLASYSRPELYQPVYYEVWVYATNFRDPQTTAPASAIYRKPQSNKVTQKTMSKLCRGVECPSFEVLRTYKYGIQKRRYYNGLFASTSPRECQFTTMSVWKGFMPLHLYKHGINSHMEVIEATRPIALVNIRDSSDPNTECPQNMTMSLYLPERLHSNPPITGYAAPDVHITTMNDVIVYAYTVGGYLLDPKRVRKELADMKYRLSEFGACYKDDEYYVVIYDFIVRYHGRQNEIWIVAENCKATYNG